MGSAAFESGRLLPIVALLCASILAPLFAYASGPFPAAGYDTLKLGLRDDAFPFSYLGPGRRHMGYSVDLCLRVVKELEANLGRSIKTSNVTVTGRNRIPNLLVGNVDIECGATSNTLDRVRLGVVFSVVTFVSDAAVLARVDLHDLKKVDDLTRLRPDDPPVVTTAGTTAVRHLLELRQRLGGRFRVAYVSGHDEAMRMLAEGGASAFLMDRVLLAARVAAGATGPARTPLRMLDGPVSPDAVEYYGLMMRDDDAGRKLKESVDLTLRKIMKNGEIDSIHERWFRQPIDAPGDAQADRATASRRSLDIEVTPALQQIFRQPTDLPFEPPAAGKR